MREFFNWKNLWRSSMSQRVLQIPSNLAITTSWILPVTPSLYGGNTSSALCIPSFTALTNPHSWGKIDVTLDEIYESLTNLTHPNTDYMHESNPCIGSGWLNPNPNWSHFSKIKCIREIRASGKSGQPRSDLRSYIILWIKCISQICASDQFGRFNPHMIWTFEVIFLKNINLK